MNLFPLLNDTIIEDIEKLSSLLINNGEYIGFAESCTSGLLASAIGAISGASTWYKGSIVSYATSVKANVLNVEESILEKEGPVSSDCAAQMAHGVAIVLGVDLGVSVTGIAGPKSDDTNKPVGLVYIGVYYHGQTRVIEYRLKGSRMEIRGKATELAIKSALEMISNN